MRGRQPHTVVEAFAGFGVGMLEPDVWASHVDGVGELTGGLSGFRGVPFHNTGTDCSWLKPSRTRPCSDVDGTASLDCCFGCSPSATVLPDQFAHSIHLSLDHSYGRHLLIRQ
jgi:hypothetical protein